MPTYSANLLAKFSAANSSYAERMIRDADANGNGNLTRAEARKLGDLRDTFELFTRAGETVKTDDFVAFYKNYVHVQAKSGRLSSDVADNYSNWLALSLPAPNAEFKAVAEAQGAALADLILDFRSEVLDYYEYGDEDVILADHAALTTFFAGATWTEMDPPAGFPSAHTAFVASGTDTAGVLENGSPIVVLDKHANIITVAFKDADAGELYTRSTISDVIDVSAIADGTVARHQEAARAISDYMRDNNMERMFPNMWDLAFVALRSNASGLNVIYDYEFFAGSDMTEDEHVHDFLDFMKQMINRTPELQQYADIEIGAYGPWGT